MSNIQLYYFQNDDVNCDELINGLATLIKSNGTDNVINYMICPQKSSQYLKRVYIFIQFIAIIFLSSFLLLILFIYICTCKRMLVYVIALQRDCTCEKHLNI